MPEYTAKPNLLFDVPLIVIKVVVGPVVNVNQPSLNDVPHETETPDSVKVPATL